MYVQDSLNENGAVLPLRTDVVCNDIKYGLPVPSGNTFVYLRNCVGRASALHIALSLHLSHRRGILWCLKDMDDTVPLCVGRSCLGQSRKEWPAKLELKQA